MFSLHPVTTLALSTGLLNLAVLTLLCTLWRRQTLETRSHRLALEALRLRQSALEAQSSLTGQGEALEAWTARQWPRHTPPQSAPSASLRAETHVSGQAEVLADTNSQTHLQPRNRFDL